MMARTVHYLTDKKKQKNTKTKTQNKMIARQVHPLTINQKKQKPKTNKNNNGTTSSFIDQKTKGHAQSRLHEKFTH